MNWVRIQDLIPSVISTWPGCMSRFLDKLDRQDQLAKTIRLQPESRWTMH